MNNTDGHGKACPTAMKDYARFLRAIEAQALEARLASGARVLDVTDFRQWLVELADRAEHAETLEQVLASKVSKPREV